MRASGLFVSVATVGLLAVGCGDDEKAETATTVAATESTVVETAPPDQAPVNPDPVKVELLTGELRIAQTVLAAGTVNFEATNLEQDPHVFSIALGESYEALPQRANGAVDVDALGDAFIGSTGLLMPGLGPVKVLTVELAPGTYVLYCNSGDDPEKGEESHISLGEYVVITVV